MSRKQKVDGERRQVTSSPVLLEMLPKREVVWKEASECAVKARGVHVSSVRVSSDRPLLEDLHYTPTLRNMIKEQ